MLQSLRISLYEVFGYLIPGALAVAAFALGFWAFFSASQKITVHPFAPEGWIAFGTLSYLAGHVIQGLCNVLTENIEWTKRVLCPETEHVPPIIHGALVPRIRRLTGLDLSSEPGLLQSVCASLIADRGTQPDREVFEYREGFYRGLMVSFALIAACLALAAMRTPLELLLWEVSSTFSRGAVLTLAATACVSSVISALRYKRFASHHKRVVMLGVLVLDDGRKHAKEEPEL